MQVMAVVSQLHCCGGTQTCVSLSRHRLYACSLNVMLAVILDCRLRILQEQRAVQVVVAMERIGPG